jgi:hypothetical protein
MANLTLNIHKSKSLLLSGAEKLAKAREVLNKATQPKEKFLVHEYTETGNNIIIEYASDCANNYTLLVSRAKLIEFTDNFYRNYYDRFDPIIGHDEILDNRTAEQYFDENTEDVINDYLNNSNL